MLNLSACTLLLNDIRHWPKTIDLMFWPFTTKAAAEQHTTLSVNSNNKTPFFNFVQRGNRDHPCEIIPHPLLSCLCT